MNDLLNETDLQQWSGYTQRTALIKWLRDNGIQFFFAKGGSVCTTLSAVNHRLTTGRPPARASNDDEIRFKA